ncbi:MAG: hypothetical protein WEA75_09220 [Acidimicrobiia bacterium]
MRVRVLIAALVIVLLAACGGTDGDKHTKKKRSATTTTTLAAATTTTTTTTTPAVGFATPEDAIRAYVEAQGNQYAGDCAGTDLETDVGKWCSAVRANDGTNATYGIGPAFAEFAEELTLVNGPGGWTVTSSAPVPGI